MTWLHRLILSFLPASVVVELPEDRTQLALERGRRARSVLADDILIDAFAEIEGRLKEQWVNAPSLATEARETLFHQVAALQSVQSQLKTWADDATFIAAQIEKRR